MATSGSPPHGTAGRQSDQLGAAEHPQPAPDPLAQRGRGLAGEGQPEHLLRPDLTGGDQVDHPRGHRLGLPRPGTGDHQRRLQRRLDDRRLLAVGAGSPRSAASSAAVIIGSPADLLAAAGSWSGRDTFRSNGSPGPG